MISNREFMRFLFTPAFQELAEKVANESNGIPVTYTPTEQGIIEYLSQEQCIVDEVIAKGFKNIQPIDDSKWARRLRKAEEESNGN